VLPDRDARRIGLDARRALAHGVPILAVPHAADQFENAAASAAAVAACVVMPDELSESAVREAAVALLEDSSYRQAARDVAAEIAAMPPTSRPASPPNGGAS